MPHRPPSRFKVSRGHWRTRKETRRILELPSSSPLPRRICRLPDTGLNMLIEATKARMEIDAKAAVENEETPVEQPVAA